MCSNIAMDMMRLSQFPLFDVQFQGIEVNFTKVDNCGALIFTDFPDTFVLK